MKNIISLLSFIFMLSVFFVPFYDSQVLNNMYRVNEIIHWIGAIAVSLFYFVAKENEEIKKEYLINIKKRIDTVLFKMNKWIDYPALAFIALYIGDMSFSIALVVCMISIHTEEKEARNLEKTS